MPMNNDLHQLPEGLPVPEDYRVTDHMPGMSLPNLAPHATSGLELVRALKSLRSRCQS